MVKRPRLGRLLGSVDGLGGAGVKPAVFVMTDVVGSTALWEAHGDSMRSALEAHDGLVHGAVESAGGRVFKHTGDGMIAAFG